MATLKRYVGVMSELRAEDMWGPEIARELGGKCDRQRLCGYHRDVAGMYHVT